MIFERTLRYSSHIFYVLLDGFIHIYIYIEREGEIGFVFGLLWFVVLT